MVDDGNGKCRLSTQAIEDSTDGSHMSVILSALMGQRSTSELASDRWPFVVSWTEAELRNDSVFDVQPDPDRGTNGVDPAHGFVIGKKTHSIQKRMRSAATGSFQVKHRLAPVRAVHSELLAQPHHTPGLSSLDLGQVNVTHSTGSF